MKARRFSVILATTALLAVSACSGSDDSSSSDSGGFDAASYFEGKTIRVVATHGAGGGTDIYARFVASKLGDAIPGHPRVTVTNEEDLGGISTVFDAKADELVVGVTSQASTLYTTILDPANTIDPTKVRIVGGIGGDPRGMVFHTDAAEAYGDDWTKANGSSGPDLKFAQVVGGPTDIVSDSYMQSWLCDTLDWPCQMASVASDDSQDLALMTKRGELNGVVGTEVGLLRDYNEELTAGDSKIAFTFAPDPATTLVPPDFVTAGDITEGLTPEQTAEFEKIYPTVTTGGLGRHFWVGPDQSEDVLDVLRTAYSEVLGDQANLDTMAVALAGGDDSLDFTYAVSGVDGVDAQAAYDENTQKFVDNIDFTKERQQYYYDKYWK